MFLARLAPRLAERGHHAPVLCNSRGGGRRELAHFLDEANVRMIARPIGGKASIRALFNLWRVVKSENCRATHSHLSSASWTSGWLDRMGVPSVGHVQGFTSAMWHRNQRQLIACSQAVKDDQIARGIPAERIEVLPNPVDPSDIILTQDPMKLRAELGVPEGAPLFGGVAHLRSEKKGWQEWIEAVPQVLQAVPDAHFWIAGQGPLRPQYEALAHELGVAHRVKFLGFRRDVADVMNALDVMALASHREPFGIVYVEAMLLGKPCIACDAGGAPDVVQNGETGLLVPPRNPQKIAEAMIHLAQNRDKAKEMGAEGREYALEHFGWQKTVEKLEQIYARMGLES